MLLQMAQDFFKLDLNNCDTELDLEEEFLPVAMQHVPDDTVFFTKGDWWDRLYLTTL